MEKRISFKITTVCFTMLMFIATAPLFAQNVDVATVYEEIDAAFLHKSTAELSSVLKTYSGTAEYYLCEAYALKKTRQYIIQDRLDFARAAALTVIDNNIDNFDAIDLYSYIDQALLAKESAKQAEENRKQLEAERKAAADERTKQRIVTGDTYQAVKTADGGKDVFINQKQVAYSQVDWKLRLGLADVLFQKATEPDFTNLKYGLAAGADILYSTSTLSLGADVFADFQFIKLSGDEEEVMASARFVPELAFAPLNKYLFLRMGIAAYVLLSEVKEITGSVDTFVTPVVGLGLNTLSSGNIDFSLHYDYCLGHLTYDGVKSAMEMGGTIFMPLTVNTSHKIGIELGVSDLLFIKDKGIDNRAKATFAIGVGNVNK